MTTEVHLPDPPDVEQIRSHTGNIFRSCYDAYCDVVSKKISVWTAILIGYNIGILRGMEKKNWVVEIEKEPCKCCGK